MLRVLLGLFLLALPATARADWHEASTGHFIIYSEQKPEALKEFALKLERFDKGIRTLRGLADPPLDRANRMIVYVVDDRGEVAKLAGSKFVAGFYHPRAGGSFAVIPRGSGQGGALSLDPQSILLHEYTHHIMWTMSENAVYPAWLVEGFAEFHATAIFGKDGSMTFGAPPLYRGVGLMRGNALPVDKLLMADTLKLSDEQRTGLYGRGWLLTHYLTIGSPPRKTQLAAYVTALKNGRKPMEAAQGFGDLPTLDREPERYKMGRFNIVKLGSSMLQVGDVALRTLTPGEAATMDVRIRSKVGGGGSSATPVYADAQKAAAPYPRDAAAQIVLAEAAFNARDMDGAEAAADRAIAADPKAIDGYVYKARSRMARAIAAKDYSAQTWNAVRAALIAGNRVAPEDPEPLIFYYQSFRMQRVAVPEDARKGLEAAFAVAPQDRALRLLTASMYLRNGQKDVARALLVTLAYDPHGGARSRRAAAMIATIDAGATEPAKAAETGEKDDGEKD